MTFDRFMETAWADHNDHAAEVAERLARSLEMVHAPAHVAPFAQLATHVYGEHLGRYREGIELLRSLSTRQGAPADTALERGIAVLRYCDAGEVPALDADDRIAVLATASSALLGRKQLARAIAAYEQAIAQAEPACGASAARALAIGGNSLACELEEKPDRSDAETRTMVMAARAGLKYWQVAGTWLEDERAQYRLARSLLQAKDPGAAAEHARRCVDVCAANSAPAFELFFGHAVLALAQRAAGDEQAFLASSERALRLHEEVPTEDKPWCKSDLDELRVR